MDNANVARFARNTVDSLKYVRKLKAMGIGVFFEEQALDSMKSENEIFLGLYSVMAQAESENISANVRWGIQQRMKSGTFAFRYTILGYRRGENGEPEIIPEEAEVVRKIFNMYLEGASLDQIKSYLETNGIKTKKANPFGVSRSFKICFATRDLRVICCCKRRILRTV